MLIVQTIQFSYMHTVFITCIWIEIIEKQLELVARADGTVLIFGQILVADETDVCTVKFVNTAVSFFSLCLTNRIA